MKRSRKRTTTVIEVCNHRVGSTLQLHAKSILPLVAAESLVGVTTGVTGLAVCAVSVGRIIVNLYESLQQVMTNP